MVANISLPTFTWNLEFYHWQQTLVVIFLDMTDSFHWFLRKCLRNTFVIWIIKFVRQSILSSKNVLSWQKQLIHVANQTSAGVLFFQTTIVLQCPAEVLFACLYFVTQNINKKYTQGPGFNKINIYSLIKHSVKWNRLFSFFLVPSSKEYSGEMYLGVTILIHAKVPAVLPAIAFAPLV